MRITNSMYYNNLTMNNARVNTALFDVNKQISSGVKIQYAFEDTEVFVKTMELDDEITTFNHVKDSAENGLKFSSQTDSTIGEMTKLLDAFKVKLVQAASDEHSDASMQAIAEELKGMRNTLLSLANTSINGQFLFSGTAVNIKPVNLDGSYNGNDESMKALLGNDLYQAYNITGQQLFLGEESQTERKISSNVPHMSLADLYPDIMKDVTIPRETAAEHYITDSNTIRDLVGDSNAQTDINNGTASYATTHFYLRGTQHDGTAFKEVITMTGDESVASLLERIGTAYGNTPTNQVVNVTINAHGQIEIQDKISGSSKLDFHMVGATDFDQADGNDEADIASGVYATPNLIENLDAGTADFEEIISGANDLLITEFVSSGFDTTSATAIDSVTYDRVAFAQAGEVLSSNVPQVVKVDNSFATAATKLLDVASGSTLDGSTLVLEGSDITGAAYSLTVNLSNAGSTFTVGGNTYTIYNTGVDPKQPISAANPQTVTVADEMTYQQLMDVINMVVTGNLPASTASVDGQGVATDYRDAINAANTDGNTYLSYDGKLTFKEIDATTTQASISMYDASGSDFTAAPSAMTFNANNALTISDPKTDFFARIDEMIASVEEFKMRADSESGNPRTGGIQNSIQMLDDLMDHLSRQQSQSGVQSQSLSAARDRTEVLIVSSISLRSEVLDTDVAEASMRLQQLSLNMQAIYSTTAKISQLSLVNYIR